MAVLTAFLFFIFGQYRTGAANGYSAVFSRVSRLKVGDSVRFVGIRVGTVNSVALRPNKTVLVTFDTDRSLTLTEGTRAAVRYLNLVGDRYLDLIDGPGSTRVLPPGSQIAIDHTSPALDLDLLLGGLKPVIQGLNPTRPQCPNRIADPNLPGSRRYAGIAIFQDVVVYKDVGRQRPNGAAADRQSQDGSRHARRRRGPILGRHQSIRAAHYPLAADRNPIGDAIQALDSGTASIADLLTEARPPLAGTVDQLSRLAPLLDQDKDRIDGQLRLLPEDYRKMARLGAYGSFLPVYLCSISFRFTDFQSRTVVVPWVKQATGRCAEPNA